MYVVAHCCPTGLHVSEPYLHFFKRLAQIAINSSVPEFDFYRVLFLVLGIGNQECESVNSHDIVCIHCFMFSFFL